MKENLYDKLNTFYAKMFILTEKYFNICKIVCKKYNLSFTVNEKPIFEYNLKNKVQFYGYFLYKDEKLIYNCKNIKELSIFLQGFEYAKSLELL